MDLVQKHVLRIAQELSLAPDKVAATARLLAEGATVPFIARYRKEMTGSLDEVAVGTIRDRLEQLAELDARRESILNSLSERGLLTDDLKAALEEAQTLARLEDIYLPFRPKKKTRAGAAREKGLAPLAERLLSQENFDPLLEATSFVDPEKGVASAEEALSGARDIVAETASEDLAVRERMRELFAAKGAFISQVVPGQEEAGAKFKDYFDWTEPVATAPSHRVLAMRRGAREGFLTLRLAPPEDEAVGIMEGLYLKAENAAAEQVRLALRDGYKRLLGPAMETETRLETKRRADVEAIRVFVDNLRQLLLSPPLGQKRVLALDPGFRTGAKLVCLDGQGNLLAHETIFIFASESARAKAGERVLALCREHGIEAVAVGNGTASRETEAFVRGLGLPAGIQVVRVDESGASIYSASEKAREEFPDLDLTVRGAASIGRRLQDPLAELVKIDPKSIGVGQYQHDVDQPALRKALDEVVESCVNAVGVEVNTASKELLTYVSGLGPALAGNIVAFRGENGPFSSRQDLRKVPRLGPKAFEQAAGFLRVSASADPLDKSAVHPESYAIVQTMAADLGVTVADLIRDPKLRAGIDPHRYVNDKVGLPTLTDIMKELERPGRDPRDRFESVAFAEGVTEITDLRPGMVLPGVVTNITRFGAFVDVGVHQDGLVHLSQLSDRYIKDPHEVVKVHQKVLVRVLEVDLQRRRIALTMKTAKGEAQPENKGRDQSRSAQPSGRQGQPAGQKPPVRRIFNDALAKALGKIEER